MPCSQTTQFAADTVAFIPNELALARIPDEDLYASILRTFAGGGQRRTTQSDTVPVRETRLDFPPKTFGNHGYMQASSVIVTDEKTKKKTTVTKKACLAFNVNSFRGPYDLFNYLTPQATCSIATAVRIAGLVHPSEISDATIKSAVPLRLRVEYGVSTWDGAGTDMRIVEYSDDTLFVDGAASMHAHVCCSKTPELHWSGSCTALPTQVAGTKKWDTDDSGTRVLVPEENFGARPADAIALAPMDVPYPDGLHASNPLKFPIEHLVQARVMFAMAYRARLCGGLIFAHAGASPLPTPDLVARDVRITSKVDERLRVCTFKEWSLDPGIECLAFVCGFSAISSVSSDPAAIGLGLRTDSFYIYRNCYPAPITLPAGKLKPPTANADHLRSMCNCCFIMAVSSSEVDHDLSAMHSWVFQMRPFAFLRPQNAREFDPLILAAGLAKDFEPKTDHWMQALPADLFNARLRHRFTKIVHGQKADTSPSCLALCTGGWKPTLRTGQLLASSNPANLLD
ncbi:MAG: hypothetical protein OSB03_02280, partial [Vicinamibacterales bacterium]|nr:hypothetical protein [Vicinamibacterales bacterium]